MPQMAWWFWRLVKRTDALIKWPPMELMKPRSSVRAEHGSPSGANVGTGWSKCNLPETGSLA